MQRSMHLCPLALAIYYYPCDPAVLFHIGETQGVSPKEKRLRAEHLHLQQQLKAELSNETRLQLPAVGYGPACGMPQ